MGSDLVELFRGVVRLETELWNRVDAAVQGGHGVPLTWLEILQTIDAHPGCRVLDITRTLAITVGGASKIVDRIERAGLCRREPNPSDARSNTIVLTEAGELLLAAANTTFERTLDDLVGGAADASELARLTASVQRLRRHLLAEPDQGSE
ncbi:MAG: MarR family winged helix-turn-helix transcriptional regulator [Actinobacteria bacterium]|nr:MarR family winged helix-turn-helix transcriptional regulator [Actinomycetota bacterium]